MSARDRNAARNHYWAVDKDLLAVCKFFIIPPEVALTCRHSDMWRALMANFNGLSESVTPRLPVSDSNDYCAGSEKVGHLISELVLAS